MLYTRKGDNGTTKTFNCDQRISKSSSIAEALGSLDETNSFLGLLKVKAGDTVFTLADKQIIIAEALECIQQDLFIIQAELAGAPKSIVKDKIVWLEEIIDGIEKNIPPVKTFFISGGTELAALSDIARTIARQAERRVITVVEEDKVKVSAETIAYLNRISSVLYACARNFNYIAKIEEKAPKYD